jgi:hypothetical protein
MDITITTKALTDMIDRPDKQSYWVELKYDDNEAILVTGLSVSVLAYSAVEALQIAIKYAGAGNVTLREFSVKEPTPYMLIN